jgi:hypothetical protein
MDIRYFHERVRDIQETLRESGFPKARLTIFAEAQESGIGVEIRPYAVSALTEPYLHKRFRHDDPEATIRDAMAFAEALIMQASRNDREVAAMLGILPDGRLIPEMGVAAE